MPAIRGSCLCGAVRFELTAPPLFMSYCHCSRCRKTGGAFAAIAMARREGFQLLAGEDAIRHFAPEPPFQHVRSFCGTCGSPLGELSGDHDTFPVAASALDDDPRVRPAIHVHAASKPAWYEISDGVKQVPGDYGA